MSIKIDIKKENPLVSIIKNGKVPVVRISKDGFRDSDKSDFFQSFKMDNAFYPKKGCFVYIGGVQGSCLESGEIDFGKISIGYLEPDDEIYITYIHRKSKLKAFTYTTAKERYLDSLEGFTRLYDKLKERGYNHLKISDTINLVTYYDRYSEAIVDSSKIKEVIEIEEKDINLLFKYSNNRFLKILSTGVLLDYYFDCLKEIPRPLALAIGCPEKRADNVERFDNIDNLRITDVAFRSVMEKTFKDYFRGEIIDNRLSSYANNLGIFTKDLNVFGGNWATCTLIDLDTILVKFIPRRLSRIDFEVRTGKDSGISYFDKERKKHELSLKDCLSSKKIYKDEEDSFKLVTMNMIKIYEKYLNLLTSLIEIEEPLMFKFLREFREMEEVLKQKGYTFLFDSNSYRFIFTSLINTEYDLFLDDFIINFSDTSCHLEELEEKGLIDYYEELYNVIKSTSLYKNIKNKIYIDLI